MVRGIRPVDCCCDRVGPRQTARSEYIREVLEAICSMPDGDYELTEDEHGEPFDDLYEATLFAHAVRGMTGRSGFCCKGLKLTAMRRRNHIYVRKETADVAR